MTEKDFIESLFFEESQEIKQPYTLLIYDITDGKRRAKFSKYMESYGVRVQKSAFEVRISNQKLRKMMDGIPKFISDEDNVRLYKIPENSKVLNWGKTDINSITEVIII